VTLPTRTIAATMTRVATKKTRSNTSPPLRSCEGSASSAGRTGELVVLDEGRGRRGVRLAADSAVEGHGGAAAGYERVDGTATTGHLQKEPHLHNPCCVKTICAVIGREHSVEAAAARCCGPRRAERRPALAHALRSEGGRSLPDEHTVGPGHGLVSLS
jgi:hypothetical protein